MGLVHGSRKYRNTSPRASESLKRIDEVPAHFKVQWVTFPNDELGIVSGMFDENGTATEDKELATHILAIDRFGDVCRFDKEDNTFGPPRHN